MSDEAGASASRPTRHGDTAGVDAARLSEFLTLFDGLAQAATQHHQQVLATSGGERVSLRMERHLGRDPVMLPVVTEVVPSLRIADADVAVERVISQHGGGELVGVGAGDQRWGMSLSDIVQAEMWQPMRIGPVEYRTEAVGPDLERNLVAFGLHLFAVDGAPVAVLQRGSNAQYGAEAKLEVVSPQPGVTARVLDEIRTAMNTHSVLRGKVVSFSSSPFEPGMGGVTFIDRPSVPPESIVLPDGLLDRLHRHVIGIGERAGELTRLGQHLKRGVLLYGAPGTGKTLTVRHLVGQTDSTVILLTGPALGAVGLATQTARALAPAIVVLEDCDLVAEERSHDGSSPLLFEVLDSLDGLEADTDLTFLLTTNRVDVLEPALAQRPGRIDLAVEVPLPDRAARRALLDVYAGHLPLSSAALDQVAREAVGTTASFARELVRRAVLDATQATQAVSDEHLTAALQEMLSEAHTIARSMFGSMPTDDSLEAGTGTTTHGE